MDTQSFDGPRVAYSPTEAAFACGISLSTVNRKIASGEIRSAKIGKRRVVLKDELERLCRGEERAA